MKKLLLLPTALLCFSFATMAQQETKLFTGDATPSQFSRMDMVSWAMGEIKTDARYVNFGTDAEPAFTRVTANPEKAALNTSDNALQLSSLKGKSWWPDFLNFDLAAPIKITEANRYLHFYHYRENLNKGFSVNINKETPWEDADKGTKRFDMDLKKAATWEDVVVDLKWFMDNNEDLSRICILVDRNWGGEAEPPTNYFFDEISLTDSNLPRGIKIRSDKPVEFFPGDAVSYNKWVTNLDLQNAENTSAIVANPFTTETAVLNTTQTMKFNKSANASWWQGARFVIDGTVPVGTDISYLHVMVNIPQMEVGLDYYVIQLNAKDFTGKQIDSGDAVKYWADDKGKWVDCVLDVSSLGYVSEFTVRCDVRKDNLDAYINSPAGEFYIDAVAIDNNPEARTSVTAPTKVKSVNGESVKVSTRNRSIFVEGNTASIEVYNVCGSLVKKVATTGSRSEISVPTSGVYIVKAVSANQKSTSTKVVIK